METFAHAGVDRTKLFQIPELVDVFHFDRQLYEDEAAIPQVAYQAYQSYSPTGHQSSSSSGHEALSTQPHPDTEKRKQPKISFLSILKWEKRKAWNEILTYAFILFNFFF